jgi:pimeloyl-ACP methyl ester carboxylesterase
MIALGIGLEEYEYPYPVHFLPLTNDFVALSAAAAQDIPLVKRVVIPDCGHIPYLEHPSPFLSDLLPFLES